MSLKNAPVFAGLWADVVGTFARARVHRRTHHDDRGGKGKLWDVRQDEGHVDDGTRGEFGAMEITALNKTRD